MRLPAPLRVTVTAMAAVTTAVIVVAGLGYPTASAAAAPVVVDDGVDPATRISCLEELSDEGYQRKGVQRRDFLKRRRFELAALGGFYASDMLSSTYTAGGSVAFFPAEDFGFELLAHWLPVRFRLEEPFSSFDRARRFDGGSAISGLAGLLFSPFHTKLKLNDTTIVHGDLFLVVGAGRTFHDSVQGLTGQVGLGLRIYLRQRFALRLDLRDFIMPQEVLGQGRVTHNLGLLVGFGLWL
jgi:outer membrane beta-barrel protein